jgi:hypothetical protein
MPPTKDTLIDVNPKDFITRDKILMLLSDIEVARVSTAEDAARLADGDEYIDLERLDLGIRAVEAGSRPNLAQAVPRSAVRDDTWAKIVACVGAGKQ